MYKLIFQTPEGSREVTFEAQPSATELANSAFNLRHKPQLCALVLPKKEGA